MLIGILETGRPPEEFEGHYGDYPAMFEALLEGNGFSFRTWAVLDGEIPADPSEADGWLITGSRYGVYEDHPWIDPLKRFIQATYDAGRPLAGICFGHQIMAEALGGRAEKSKKGWGLGAHTYETDAGEAVSLYAFHQDQVTEKPPQAQVVARSEFCEYAALAYRENTVSIQPHPEFQGPYLDALLDVRRSILPQDRLADATAAREKSVAQGWAATWIAAALKANQA